MGIYSDIQGNVLPQSPQDGTTAVFAKRRSKFEKPPNGTEFTMGAGSYTLNDSTPRFDTRAILTLGLNEIGTITDADFYGMPSGSTDLTFQFWSVGPDVPIVGVFPFELLVGLQAIHEPGSTSGGGVVPLQWPASYVWHYHWSGQVDIPLARKVLPVWIDNNASGAPGTTSVAVAVYYHGWTWDQSEAFELSPET